MNHKIKQDSFGSPGNPYGYDETSQFLNNNADFLNQNAESLAANIPDIPAFEPTFKVGDTVEYYELLGQIFKSRGLKFESGVPGGGCGEVISNFVQGKIDTTVTSGEVPSVAQAIGNQALLKGGWSAVFGTHGVAPIFQADPLAYLSEEGYMNALVIMGANPGGSTLVTEFQHLDEIKRYKGIYGKKYIFKITNEFGKSPEDLIELCNRMDKAYRKGKPMLVSIPNDFGRETVKITQELYDRIITPPRVEANPLTQEAKDQLDALAERINESEDRRVLFMPGEGLKHTIRIGGIGVWNKLSDLMNKVGCNAIYNADNADLQNPMASNNIHELPVASHNKSPELHSAVRQCDTVVCLGTGPNATITGIGHSLQHYRRTPSVIIDSSQKRLNKWQEALTYEVPDKENGGKKKLCNMVGIKADIRSAIDYLNEKIYKNVEVRSAAAKQIAHECWDALFNGEQELIGAPKMRTLYAGVAASLAGARNEDGKASKIGMCVDSGDCANLFLRYRKNFGGPGTLYYPPQGTLSQVTGAAYSFARHGDFDKVVLFTGDGGMGYSEGELAYLAKLAKERQIPVVVVVFNNGHHEAVRKGRDVFGHDEVIKQGIEDLTELANKDFSKCIESFMTYDPKGASVDGEKPEEVAKAVEEALNYKGFTIIDVNTRKIERSKPATKVTATVTPAQKHEIQVAAT